MFTKKDETNKKIIIIDKMKIEWNKLEGPQAVKFMFIVLSKILLFNVYPNKTKSKINNLCRLINHRWDVPKTVDVYIPLLK